ncbi:hypothetical protein BDV32DRAFT_148280 [Aspergillus pseudonomiae]|uniref:Uncharacterized protein n=1 Tax=Aspergillus pseudonomiae TaxID=1506151 RepID=A0A5N6I643_9EURO|nr:uncharacterized protein BDV37DRAFT_280478 [Aspergillus pseudonomiae]KAB8261634.1 hypothetical protein BDV32DRAFT_148280 [Aspergillus pseudonomiae]KAE8406866.1 hypothetical protein BDV37DRAFT_280478 [Aspergillus pseudonomiae]
MNSDPLSLADKPAAYGSSCANCAQSKRKCIVRAAGGPCQRCYQTNKDCKPAKTVRRRGVAKKSAATSQASRLEEKIDSLVSLMKAGGQTGAAVSQVISSAEAASKLGTNQEKYSAPASDDGSRWNGPDGDQTNASTPATTDSVCSPGISDLSSHESEECLNHFRTFKLQYFPFVHIPFDKSAGELRRERPFLWLCIMAISTKSTARQHELGLKIRQIVAQEMVVQSDKSIDLLLGLLTFIGWASYQFHQFHPKPFLSVFTHLATSLVFDLGLNKPVQVTPSTFNLHQSPKHSTPRTMEERRAALGCYLITSIISSFFQRIETFRWTTHLDESLQILDEQKQCVNDEILVQLVRMRLIVEKNRTRQVSLHDASEGTGLADDEAALFSNVKAEIFKSSPNDVILLHLYSNELEIAASSLSLTPCDVNASRQDHLFHALTSINSWFNILLMIPPAGYVSFSFAIFSQVSRCLLALYRLATLDAPNWDKNLVQQTANPLSILNRLVNALEQVPAVVGIDNSNYPNGDLFSRSAQILRSLRPEWESKLGSDDMVPVEPSTHDLNGIQMPDASFFGDDSLYDSWFMELMSCPI